MVFQLARQGRTAEEIRADLQATHAQYDARVRTLLAELEGAPARPGSPSADPFAEQKQSKAQAAHELGISEKRLSSLLVRYQEAYPDRAKLAVQPAGFKNSRWLVYTDRVRRVIESGEPY
ncbi:hypothetical protein [Methylobacterium sp. SI9]|uniref:hypothetical protein n=1 Tax=Methylobacterium guangdongense TaxID=3138811 RepID=UPI00313B303F